MPAGSAPGQIASDDPSRDENHDESRRNAFDPAVARALKGEHGEEDKDADCK
jgi:hypothetical protein